MQKITPFMWFDRECEEAMNFYVSVFSSAPNAVGESKVLNIKRYPAGITEGPMAGFDGKVLTGVFTLSGQKFMALDGGPIFKASGAISYLVQCADQAEIDHFWNALSSDPASEQCGWCKDKYGFSWQIVPDMGKWLGGPETEASARAMAAMMQMKKIDIAKMQDAFDGK